ncbi:hypothetical protein CRM76_12035 [Edwardsiella tarda]|uniref:Uncharacterized protein n=1 Tax=Edwardsiella tarda TaxID=636 RepID=A0A2A7U2L4_EDWTA|nr:hypothetical protein CRM76_12035 [Edwardsiella tarda]
MKVRRVIRRETGLSGLGCMVMQWGKNRTVPSAGKAREKTTIFGVLRGEIITQSDERYADQMLW